MKSSEQVTLENLGHGAAMEMFQAELERVIANIADPNTKPDAPRSVTLKLKLKPAKDRSMCDAEISCESKLAPVLPFESVLYVGMENGAARATEYNPNQMNLPFSGVEEVALTTDRGKFTMVK